MLEACRRNQSIDAQLDRFIPREKWEVTGLNKLTGSEQQTLADEITSLLGATRTAQSGVPAGRDKTQWRKLKRRMSKEEVRKLLGEPQSISVSRYNESWSYLGGDVMFDGKGRLDSWIEPQY
jgi:hypothetical protein